MEEKLKVLSIETKEVDPKDPIFKKLKRRFFLAQIPFIGRWLAGSYISVNADSLQGSMYGKYDPETQTHTEMKKEDIKFL